MAVGQVVLPGVGNNAGFDSLVLHDTIDGRRHLLIIENRFSEAGATTSLSWAAAEDGIVKKVQAVRVFLDKVFALKDEHPIGRSGVARYEQVTFLVVAARNANANFAETATAWLSDKSNGIEFNVGVITRQALLKCYGTPLREATAFTLSA